jgi:hypothetical protein
MAVPRFTSWIAIASFSGFLGALAAAGCGGDSGTSNSTSGGGGATGGGPSTSTTSASTGGSGGGGGGGAAPWVPTPADTQYQAVSPLPSGEIILFSDWNAFPTTLNAVPAAGGAKTTVFESYVVWSFAVAPSSRRIAFSSGFPDDLQLQHYGTNSGNAIQPTWLYDPTTQDITLVTSGNLNDECHLFGPGEKNLYICRRTDFDAMGMSKNYRVGVISLKNDAFTFLTAEIADEDDLYPAVNADETELLFGSDVIQSSMQTFSVKVEGLPPTTPTVVRANAYAPVFSPDHSRLAYTDYGDMGALYVANADGSNPVKIATEGGDSAVWSPDGTRVAFLVYDSPNNCSHIDIAAADGSEVDAPVRFRDCSTTGEFISAIGWVGP